MTYWNVVLSEDHDCSILELYYRKHFSKYMNTFSYHPVVAVVLFVADKLTIYAWTLADIFVAVLARAVSKQFELHFKHLKNSMYELGSKQAWIWVTKEHEQIAEIQGHLNKLIKPLIFNCVAVNIYFIALSLNRFLIPQAAVKVPEKEYVSLLRQVSSIWAFLQLFIRCFIMLMSCAKVNEEAHKLEEVLWKCPAVMVSKEVPYE